MHWDDVEEIIESLEENYYDEDISKLKLSELDEMVRSLSEFDDHAVNATNERLSEILEAWLELRDI